MWVVAIVPFAGLAAANEDSPRNTQEETIPFTTPEQALAALKLPEGFKATLFAAEPLITQPISMAFDERGRMWVAECHSYSDVNENFSDEAKDKIVVFTDSDNDGQADERKIFWAGGRRLTSALPGLGGIWALDAPRLLFFPDKNRDDVPDGLPEVVLDGFDDDAVRHNIVNGLMWGPDGWLYGRHGILVTSYVGAPGTPQEKRTQINCGVWRFHPFHKTFEVVATGTTNPWGMDFNEHGELFLINTVIGHLWHVVPGAHFQRMYGSDFDPYLYRLLPQTADHFHWDTAEAWSDIRKIGVSPTTDIAGGGHAHCGLMIYQGDNWPVEYRGKVFTVNLHGRRINCDRLERQGCGYVGKHDADLFSTSDPWFRGIEMVYGPDGGVYLADWSDIGECHENDGIHRTSGRIFKVTYGEPKPVNGEKPLDLAKESDQQLVSRLASENEWFVRQSRLQLQERSMRPQRRLWNGPQLVEDAFLKAKDSRIRVAALGTLHAIGATKPDHLAGCLAQAKGDEHVRALIVRLLAELADKSAPAVLRTLAATEESGLVRLYLASALQKLPIGDRLGVAEALVQHAEDADDPWQSLMIWYGVSDCVPADPEEAVALAGVSKISIVREFIIRRVMQDGGSGREAVAGLVASTRGADRVSVLRGMVEGLKGVRRTNAPTGWSDIVSAAEKEKDAEALQLVRELGAVFGEGRALEELRKTAADGNADAVTRNSSIRSLAESRDVDAAPLLVKLLSDQVVVIEAVRGIAVLDPKAAPDLLLGGYSKMHRLGREEAVAAMCSRPEWAKTLLHAVEAGTISKENLPPFQLRQIMNLGDEGLAAEVLKMWPDVQQSAKARQERIASLRTELTDQRLSSAALPHGRAIFEQNCAKCHKLFGEGGATAPDLTGAQRSNLNYLLENIVDPSLTVSANFRMSVVALVDGRVLNGVVSDRTDKTLQLQTPTERLTLPLDEIDEIRETNLSLMPEGQLDVISADDVRDLIGYLMSPRQVAKGP
jgi:putative membrane-bound dehydrogenase-like protein